ncbi:MAG: 3-phosphoshikimate 1-carboxyvinyltransferase, partial [Candidatus Eremiobacteraeota bacterium]|nr:3-phosphoshikimate 1-carboxyvinyltransferase [Candidatus Eremiobacteraeota bacterium]
ETTLDCMNSGSTARMLLGLCCGANVPARFDGDVSLRRRPMEPLAAQLRAFGAKIETTDGRLPLQLLGTPAIETRNFILLSPSAQVKSALLFAALFSGVAITISGDRGSRDHTERLLRYLGAEIRWDGQTIVLQNGVVGSRPLDVPGDFSSGAFFMTAAAITPGSRLVIRDLGINPTRTGLLDALRAMGSEIATQNEHLRCGEPVADVAVSYAPLTGVSFGAELALRAIDEIPLLAIAGACADGETTIHGVADLRTKESDRLASLEGLLRLADITVSMTRDGFIVRGGRPISPSRTVETHGDHRIAMAAAVLACVAGPVTIDDRLCVDVSFPSFTESLARLRA